MARLSKANNDLDKMTSQTISIETQKLRVKAHRYAVPDFPAIQAHAASCYNALSTSWKCSCWGDHTLSLRLESRGYSSDDKDESHERGDFHIIFRNRSGRKSDTDEVLPPAWTWEEADVHVIRGDHGLSLDVDTQCGVRAVRLEAKAKKAINSAQDPSANTIPIECLCAAINKLQKSQREKCLSLRATEYAEQKYGVHIYPLSERPPQPDT